MKTFSGSASILFIISLLAIFSSCSKKNQDTDNFSHVGWAVGLIENNAGTILHTSNNGLDWERQNTTLTEGVDLNCVSAISENESWIVGSKKDGYGLILRTQDGGTTWQRIGSKLNVANFNIYGIVAINNQNVWICGDSGVVMNTLNAGNTWTEMNIDSISGASFTSITTSGVNNIWVIGTCLDSTGLNSVIMHSGNAGLTWERQGKTDIFTNHLSDIQAVNDTTIFISGNHHIYRSTNGGKNWFNVMYGNFDFEGICMTDENDIWSVSENNSIYHSKDMGFSWDTIHSSYTGTSFYGITGIDNAHVWATGFSLTGGSRSVLLYTQNAGTTWFDGKNESTVCIKRVSFPAGAK